MLPLESLAASEDGADEKSVTGTFSGATSYRFTEQTGEIGGRVAGPEVVRSAVYKRLKTPRGVYSIYSRMYGSDLWKLCGLPVDYAQAMVPELISEALLRDERIYAVDGFSFARSTGVLRCSFTVHTVYGTEKADWEVATA